MQLPSPVRAVVGLLANAADEAKQLPDRAIELPMLAVSTALQMSLRAQQRYARLAARGDEILQRRSVTDDPPPWAMFDEPVPVEQLRAASQLLNEGLDAEPADPAPAPAPARRASAKKAAARKPPIKAAPAMEPAAPETSAKAGPAKAAPAKAGPAKAVSARKATPRKSTKTISAPRHTAPSRFDTVDDE